ncbi:MAG: hypothetical protein ABWY68_09245, partial [Cryobacterium sp.]
MTPTPSESVRVRELDSVGAPAGVDRVMSAEDFPRFAADRERGAVRWVWAETAGLYPLLLRAGIRV